MDELKEFEADTNGVAIDNVFGFVAIREASVRDDLLVIAVLCQKSFHSAILPFSDSLCISMDTYIHV